MWEFLINEQNMNFFYTDETNSRDGQRGQGPTSCFTTSKMLIKFDELQFEAR